VDFCGRCGAKDWKAESGIRRFFRTADRDADKLFTSVEKTVEEFFRKISIFVGTIIVAGLIIALLLGGLWLVIALVKFMWEHS